MKYFYLHDIQASQNIFKKRSLQIYQKKTFVDLSLRG